MLLEGLVARVTELESQLADVKARLAELDAKPKAATPTATTTPAPASKPVVAAPAAKPAAK